MINSISLRFTRPLLAFTRFALITMVAIAFSTSSYAEFGYSYVEIEYEHITFESDGSDLNAGDFPVEGSFGFTDNFFVYGSYRTYDVTQFQDFDMAEIGLGVHAKRSESLDLVASLGYIASEINSFGQSRDRKAIHLQLGMRGELTPDLEWEGFVGYRNIGEFQTAFSGAFRYRFSPNVYSDIEVLVGDEVNTYGIGVRFLFGQ